MVARWQLQKTESTPTTSYRRSSRLIAPRAPTAMAPVLPNLRHLAASVRSADHDACDRAGGHRERQRPALTCLSGRSARLRGSAITTPSAISRHGPHRLTCSGRGDAKPIDSERWIETPKVLISSLSASTDIPRRMEQQFRLRTNRPYPVASSEPAPRG